jgi:hypothetical protein
MYDSYFTNAMINSSLWSYFVEMNNKINIWWSDNSAMLEMTTILEFKVLSHHKPLLLYLFHILIISVFF